MELDDSVVLSARASIMGHFFCRSAFLKNEIKNFISWENIEDIADALQYDFNDYCRKIKISNLSQAEKEDMFYEEIKQSLKTNEILSIVFGQNFNRSVNLERYASKKKNKIDISRLLIQSKINVFLNNLNIN